MSFLRLALRSLRNRLFATCLTILSIALSTALLLSVERTKRAAEEGFTQSISQTDLIVGARSGPLNLILYTVFNMGSATNNISWQTYQELKAHPAVDWTIPYSLGDGHRGFRVVGTDSSFYEHYRFRGQQKVEMQAGVPASGLWDVVLGSEVARKLSYKLGDQVVLAHGVTRGEGIQKHDDKPFTVVGIMKSTGTALDTSLYITLQGMEAIHLDWASGAAPTKDTAIPASQISTDQLEIKTITAFFLRTKSRIETLRLQRQINEYKEEPLLAIIPGVTLAELWRGLGYVDQALKVISWMVVAVGLVGMLIALLTSLNERRREMAILRSLGAGPGRITALLVLESTLLTLSGVTVGLVLQLSTFSLLRGWLENQFGLYLVGKALTLTEVIYVVLTLVLGILIGLIPALKASQSALKDGLSVRI
jgi:putative ABC transport system permease protein